jgi:hypothetical protein
MIKLWSNDFSYSLSITEAGPLGPACYYWTLF